MKKTTKLFLIFQMLDIFISAVAIQSKIAFEGNPIGFSLGSIIIKLLIANIVCFALERTDFPKIIWIIPGISGLVVVWNLFVIVFEVLA